MRVAFRLRRRTREHEDRHHLRVHEAGAVTKAFLSAAVAHRKIGGAEKDKAP
jgi:hypothetical protein